MTRHRHCHRYHYSQSLAARIHPIRVYPTPGLPSGEQRDETCPVSAGSTRPKRLATERLPERGLLFGLPIVTSKLVAPPLPIGFTPRPRVAGALAGAAGTVCIVLAPAGYGKTTATVEEVAGEGAENVAWLSIDAYDSTELSFWAHLAASIDMVRPGVLRAMVDANEQSPVLGGGRLAASLLAALDGDEGLVVVLDDLHHLRSRALWEQLGFFLERLPPGIRVIATTRTVTSLPVESCRTIPFPSPVPRAPARSARPPRSWSADRAPSARRRRCGRRRCRARADPPPARSRRGRRRIRSHGPPRPPGRQPGHRSRAHCQLP